MRFWPKSRFDQVFLVVLVVATLVLLVSWAVGWVHFYVPAPRPAPASPAPLSDVA